jgi:hypothetical protein
MSFTVPIDQLLDIVASTRQKIHAFIFAGLSQSTVLDISEDAKPSLAPQKRSPKFMHSRGGGASLIGRVT